jgi:nucleoside-diphosphate-sugar epimerase
VEPRPNNPYGITKLACEHLAETYARLFGLDAVTLRYFTVYGPRQRPDMAFARIVDALARGEPSPAPARSSLAVHVEVREKQVGSAPPACPAQHVTPPELPFR